MIDSRHLLNKKTQYFPANLFRFGHWMYFGKYETLKLSFPIAIQPKPMKQKSNEVVPDVL